MKLYPVMIEGRPVVLRLIAWGTFEDTEGQPWIKHAQRGWIRVARDSRATISDRKVRLLLRFREDPRAMRCAERMGPYAVHALQLGYA